MDWGNGLKYSFYILRETTRSFLLFIGLNLRRCHGDLHFPIIPLSTFQLLQAKSKVFDKINIGRPKSDFTCERLFTVRKS